MTSATTLGDWVLAVEGTPLAAQIANGLALVSALMHATLGALQKGRHDPWTSRGVIDVCSATMALPVALFVVPWPDAHLFLILVGAWVVQSVFKFLMAMAYARGHYTLVYPIVRGTGPLVTVVLAGIVFGEHFTLGQWLGVLVLSGGIFALAVVNVRRVKIGRETLLAAVGFAVLTGVATAAYTTYDAYGIRVSPDPFTFLAWFFVFDIFVMPTIAVLRYRRRKAAGLPPEWDGLAPLFRRGMAGALAGFCSFGAVMLATRLDKVGEAAALRETSVVFAGIIGWLFLGEAVGRLRAFILVVIAVGAILIEAG